MRVSRCLVMLGFSVTSRPLRKLASHTNKTCHICSSPLNTHCRISSEKHSVPRQLQLAAVIHQGSRVHSVFMQGLWDGFTYILLRHFSKTKAIVSRTDADLRFRLCPLSTVRNVLIIHSNFKLTLRYSRYQLHFSAPYNIPHSVTNIQQQRNILD